MSTSDYLRQVTLGSVEQRPDIKLISYQRSWVSDYQNEADKIRAALGNRVLRLEHVGSTSVPGLTAKPIIDILLVVADSADEEQYVPALEQQGYYLRIREPDWHHHRMLRHRQTAVHLHVFSRGCSEARQMLNFRDWLRLNTADRQLYQATKADLATRDWATMQAYADAKGPVVTAIKQRANQYFKQHATSRGNK